jgi:hypothetical protein
MVADVYNTGTWETEAGGVQGQSGLHNKTRRTVTGILISVCITPEVMVLKELGFFFFFFFFGLFSLSFIQ